eukprot:11971333-Prorocentrum_lima.AAC.1
MRQTVQIWYPLALVATAGATLLWQPLAIAPAVSSQRTYIFVFPSCDIPQSSSSAPWATTPRSISSRTA